MWIKDSRFQKTFSLGQNNKLQLEGNECQVLHVGLKNSVAEVENRKNLAHNKYYEKQSEILDDTVLAQPNVKNTPPPTPPPKKQLI